MFGAFTAWMRTAQLISGLPGSDFDPDGEWTPLYAAPVPIVILIPQPVKSMDIVQLPEGEHRRNYRKTWTQAVVKVREGEADADLIVYNGRIYKVFEARDWTEPPWAGFTKVIMREQVP